MNWIIYKYTSPSKRCYIGQTRDEKARIRGHKSCELSEERDTKFARAIRKYGYGALKYEIIDTANSQEEANQKEVHWIKFYDSINSGYNITEGGDSFVWYQYDDRIVEDIKHLLKNTNLKQKEIAYQVGVSMTMVNEIKTGVRRNDTPIIRPSHQSQKGSSNKQSKLSEDQVKEIREKLKAGTSRKELQQEYNVSKTLIQLIATNQMWGHVEADYSYKPKEVNGNAKLTAEIVKKLKEDLPNMTRKEVAQKYGISVPTVDQIKAGKTWKDV